MGIEVYDRTIWNKKYDLKPGRILTPLSCDNCDIEFNQILRIELITRDEDDPKYTIVESEMTLCNLCAIDLVEKLSAKITFDKYVCYNG